MWFLVSSAIRVSVCLISSSYWALSAFAALSRSLTAAILSALNLVNCCWKSFCFCSRSACNKPRSLAAFARSASLSSRFDLASLISFARLKLVCASLLRSSCISFWSFAIWAVSSELVVTNNPALNSTFAFSRSCVSTFSFWVCSVSNWSCISFFAVWLAVFAFAFSSCKLLSCCAAKLIALVCSSSNCCSWSFVSSAVLVLSRSNCVALVSEAVSLACIVTISFFLFSNSSWTVNLSPRILVTRSLAALASSSNFCSASVNCFCAVRSSSWSVFFSDVFLVTSVSNLSFAFSKVCFSNCNLVSCSWSLKSVSTRPSYRVFCSPNKLCRVFCSCWTFANRFLVFCTSRSSSVFLVLASRMDWFALSSVVCVACALNSFFLKSTVSADNDVSILNFSSLNSLVLFFSSFCSSVLFFSASFSSNCAWFNCPDAVFLSSMVSSRVSRSALFWITKASYLACNVSLACSKNSLVFFSSLNSAPSSDKSFNASSLALIASFNCPSNLVALLFAFLSNLSLFFRSSSSWSRSAFSSSLSVCSAVISSKFFGSSTRTFDQWIVFSSKSFWTAASFAFVAFLFAVALSTSSPIRLSWSLRAAISAFWLVFDAIVTGSIISAGLSASSNSTGSVGFIGSFKINFLLNPNPSSVGASVSPIVTVSFSLVLFGRVDWFFASANPESPWVYPTTGTSKGCFRCCVAERGLFLDSSAPKL